MMVTEGRIYMMYPYMTFSDDELRHWKEYVQNNAHIIMELARDGGFANATAV